MLSMANAARHARASTPRRLAARPTLPASGSITCASLPAEQTARTATALVSNRDHASLAANMPTSPKLLALRTRTVCGPPHLEPASTPAARTPLQRARPWRALLPTDSACRHARSGTATQPLAMPIVHACGTTPVDTAPSTTAHRQIKSSAKDTIATGSQ